MLELEKWIPGISQEWLWIVQVFIVVLITAFANFFIKRFLARLLSKLGGTRTNWDDIVLQAMTRPLGWLVWLVGIDFAASIIYTETDTAIFSASETIRNIGVLICITWFVLGFIRGAEQEITQKSEHFDKHTAEAMSKLVRLTVIITAVLVILQTMGFSISGVLAMGGVGGIAVGFAAKDLLANFFGGLIIYLDRPFSIGDWIRSPDRAIEGTVEKIGWRITVIQNFESQPMYVPNSVFTNIVVENPSRMANRRIYETIGLRYRDIDSMNTIVAEVKDLLTNHEAIETGQTMIVNFNKFSDSSVDFFIYAFTKTSKWVEFHSVKQEIMLKIAAIIEANQAEIAFPTSTLHLASPVTLENSST
ncbi:MAG: mechanosensitive ion channel family protein [Gammaproteobacteria bacterium]|nr:mechanosensitive ion channel family protein [Gammaproteobacteria bacterium]